MRMILLAAILVTLISACSNDEDKKSQADKSHILSGQFQALEKARGVENILQDGQERRDSIIEEQTQ